MEPHKSWGFFYGIHFVSGSFIVINNMAIKTFKNLLNTVFLCLVVLEFSGCSTSKTLQQGLPFKLGKAYYQHIITDEAYDYSNIDVYIPVVSNPLNIALDSVFFRGKQSKLQTSDNRLYVGRFQIPKNKDVIMSSDPIAEFKNTLPERPKTEPFKLEANACVISYKEGNTIKYYKIPNLFEK